MARFVRSTYVVLTITFCALVLSGCNAKTDSPSAVPPAQGLSAGMNAAQDASQSVGQINEQTDAALDAAE